MKFIKKTSDKKVRTFVLINYVSTTDKQKCHNKNNEGILIIIPHTFYQD